jgi:uncharacterized protein (DUF952 family)
MEALLVHLCGAREWEDARPTGRIRPEPHVGFVHLSAPWQVHLPANRLFGGRTDVVVLYVDPTRLTAPLRWEPGVPTDPESMLFPHLYGELPVSAVVDVGAYRPQSDGRFAPLAPSGES